MASTSLLPAKEPAGRREIPHGVNPAAFAVTRAMSPNPRGPFRRQPLPCSPCVQLCDGLRSPASPFQGDCADRVPGTGAGRGRTIGDHVLASGPGHPPDKRRTSRGRSHSGVALAPSGGAAACPGPATRPDAGKYRSMRRAYATNMGMTPRRSRRKKDTEPAASSSARRSARARGRRQLANVRRDETEDADGCGT